MSSSLKSVLADIAKKHGLEQASLAPEDGIRVFSTGNLAIDHVVGVDGLPGGRSVELFGPPSSGKTTTALMAAAEAQRQGRRVLYLDYEHALDEGYCESLGFDVSHAAQVEGKTILYQPETLEQGMNAALALIDTGEIGVSIWDSVAAMTPAAVFETEDVGKVTVAAQARALAQALKKLNPILARTDTLAVFVNHLMEKIDPTPMGARMASRGFKQTTTPGGNALKFFASVRIEYKQLEKVKGRMFNSLTNEFEESAVGSMVRVTVVKNKVAPPFRSCDVRVLYGRGFSNDWTALQVLISRGTVKKMTGGIYRFPPELAPELGLDDKGHAQVRGEANLLALMAKTPAFSQRVVSAAKEALLEGPVGASEVVVEDEASAVLEEVEAPTLRPPGDIVSIDELLGAD